MRLRILATQIAPELLLQSRASANRGRREDRVHAAPAVSCARCTKKAAHEHTGSAEAIRPSLREWFRFPSRSPRRRIPLVTVIRGLMACERPGWARKTSADLTPATGAR